MKRSCEDVTPSSISQITVNDSSVQNPSPILQLCPDTRVSTPLPPHSIAGRTAKERLGSERQRMFGSARGTRQKSYKIYNEYEIL